MSVVNVRVSKSRIDECVKQDAKHCAIAQAVVDSNEDVVWCSATTEFLTFGTYSDEMVYRYRMPKAGKDFIIAFDNDRDPKPFQLVINKSQFVSMRPRRTQQAVANDVLAKRKYLAKVEKRPLRDVTPEEVTGMVFTSDGGTYTRSTPSVIRRTASQKTTGPAPVKRNHRPSIAEAINK